MRIIMLVLLAASSGLLTTACAPGNGEGLGDDGRPLGATGGDVPLTATLESIQANVFDVSCAVSGCHSGVSAPLGLDLSEGESYANLASRVSIQQPDKLRVAPGDAANSYLVQKLEGASGISGERMPRGGGRLDQALIDAVKQWIDQGAPVSLAGVVSAPVVSSSSVGGNSALDALPASLQLVFSQPLNPDTVVDLTLTLLSAGGDEGFSDGNEAALVVQPSLSADGITLTLDLSANAAVGNNSINDDYQLVLKGSGAAVVRSVQDSVLDGDNDGQPGGDYVLRFFTGSGLRPTLSSLEQNFFTPNCAKSGCHAGATPQVGLSLEAGNVYANTVGIASVFQPSTNRIQPGNADASAIIQAIEGTTTAIPQMPFDNPGGISQAELDVLRQWINLGANP